MRPRAFLLAGTLILCACAPTPAPPPADFRIDCALGYDTLAARIAAIPEVKLARTPGEPYHYFTTADGHDSYVVTLPGGAGHPAVIQQSASPQGLVQTGCSYGDRPGYDQLITYLKSLAGVHHP